MANAHVHHSRYSLYLPGRFAPQLSKKIASYILFSKTAHASSPFPLSADRCIPYPFEKIKANQPEPPRFLSGDRRTHCRVPLSPLCPVSTAGPCVPTVWGGSFFPCTTALLQSNEASPAEHPHCLGSPTLERRREEMGEGREGKEGLTLTTRFPHLKVTPSLPPASLSPWRREQQPPPVFWPGESHGQRSWWAPVRGVAESWPRLNEHLSRAAHHSASGYSAPCKYSYRFTFLTFLPGSLYSSPMGLPYAFQKTCPACCHVMTSSHESALSLNVIFPKRFPSTP